MFVGHTEHVLDKQDCYLKSVIQFCVKVTYSYISYSI